MKDKLLRCGKYLKSNSRLLLTIGTVIGVGTVIFTTAKATVKTKEDLEALKESPEDVTKVDVAKVIVKDCWPVALAAGATITMTIGNHRISSEKIRTATVAYEFYREAYETYREKVREKLGKDEDRVIEAERRVKKYDIDPELIQNVGNGNVLFIEGVSGQAFRSSVDYIRQCEKQFNQYELRGADWAPFNNWLCMLELRPMSSAVGDYLGFSERFEHDGLNVTLTPSTEVFGTGETATILTYEDPLCTEGDYRVIDW